ncbi:unnamed protein product, partial [marine sediment metagenome]
MRSGPQISEVNTPSHRREAWFSEAEGKVFINTAMASFEKAVRWGVRAK